MKKLIWIKICYDAMRQIILWYPDLECTLTFWEQCRQCAIFHLQQIKLRFQQIIINKFIRSQYREFKIIIYRQMNISEARTAGQSPPQKFSKLNQSQQLIPEECLPPTLQSLYLSPRRDAYKKGIKKTYKMKDNERKKMVWCNIYVNEMDPIQLARSKKGKQCRICSMEEETSRFVYPCMCSGTAKYVHEECLKNWILLKNGVEKVYKNDIKCEVCQHKISMKVQFQEEVHSSIFQEVPKHQKACWLILIFIILLQIAGAVILGVLVGFSNVGLAAAITLLGVISIVLIIYLVAKVMHSLTVETIVQWVFQNYQKEYSPDKIGTIINIPQQSVINTSPRSPRQRRQSCVPQFSGLQIIQFEQYPSDV
ncbi:unnamed protein product (macronuclear) [Paramecium tetraurelia]|uniref:RING-CH-type domain-containing protein n=1 Tax=Paramecium tetraurelia TaxID=5888 RepID=A0BYX0_PARTE|nr:uncharacterized protein GSPATT00033590001 [Paramecium tetraurelia]CAK63737.1 unnamed protein product [Paramecium tetraurelia]|eukprot:XP_001431135.1 hypothetical protein (macronuclear) [Paramecium tetraurelia strain d4-2]